LWWILRANEFADETARLVMGDQNLPCRRHSNCAARLASVSAVLNCIGHRHGGCVGVSLDHRAEVCATNWRLKKSRLKSALAIERFNFGMGVWTGQNRPDN